MQSSKMNIEYRRQNTAAENRLQNTAARVPPAENLSPQTAARERRSLQLQLGPPPVSPLGVVPDRVTGLHPDPLWDRAVLLALLGQNSLDPESLQGRHGYLF